MLCVTITIVSLCLSSVIRSSTASVEIGWSAEQGCKWSNYLVLAHFS